MFVFCECCVLSGRGLCNGLITRPEESYRLRCVVVYDLETSRMRRPLPTGGSRAKRKKLPVGASHVFLFTVLLTCSCHTHIRGPVWPWYRAVE
jgi:hypothetical protein